MPSLLVRDGAAATAASSGGSGISLGVIIAVVVIGTVFVAVCAGLLLAWVARRQRQRRRLTRHRLEEQERSKQMMSLMMMRDSGESGPQTANALSESAVATAAAAAAASNYFRPGAASNCSSSTCCSMASSSGSFASLDSDFEGAGVTWWWAVRWRRFWHRQRTWLRRQKHRVPAVMVGRTGSNSSSASHGNGRKMHSLRNNCSHDHGHHGHHHHRRGAADGSPRKLRRRRPETSIISSTNSLFFPSFPEDGLLGSNNERALVSHAADVRAGLRQPPPTFTVVRPGSYPPRPPPPSEHQRLLPAHGGARRADRQSVPMWLSGTAAPSLRYHPQHQRQLSQQALLSSSQQQKQTLQQGPSLQPPPPISTRSLPRPPQPALIIPDRPASDIPPGVPFHTNMTPSQQQQMMLMMRQQQQQKQQQLHQQFQQQFQLQMQQHYMQQQQQQKQPRLPRSTYRSLPQNFSTDSALSEILRSTEERLQQLQEQQAGSRASVVPAAIKATATDVAARADNADEDEPIKRNSQQSVSDADSMFVNDSHNNTSSGADGRPSEGSPVLGPIVTPLSSPSKSPARTPTKAPAESPVKLLSRISVMGLSGTGAANLSTVGNTTNSNSVMAYPMMLPPPEMLLPQQATLSTGASSPETRSSSSVYSSSPASSRSSLSTVYSADERSEKATPNKAGRGVSTPPRGTNQTAPVDDADKDLVPAALSTPKTRALHGMSAVGLGLALNAANRASAPDPPTRSLRRSVVATPQSAAATRGGNRLPSTVSTNSLASLANGSPTSARINNTPGSGHLRNRHDQAGAMVNAGPPAVRFLVTSPSRPNNAGEGTGTSAKPTPDKTANQQPGLLSPPSGGRSLKERLEALQAGDEPAQPTPVTMASLASLSRQPSVRPLPQPPTPSSGTKRNTVIDLASELRRMNSVAYSDTSSCYSNATSAYSNAASAPGPGLTQSSSRRGGGRRRNSGAAGESRSGGGSGGHEKRNSANRSSAVGTRQYLALGKKRTSQVAASGGSDSSSSSSSSSDKENSHEGRSSDTTPPAAAATGSASATSPTKRGSLPPGSLSMLSAARGTPQRSRSTLRRVEESPDDAGSPALAAALSPRAKANTGRPLRKTSVGRTGGKQQQLLRGGTGSAPSTPSKVWAPGRAGQAEHRDSLGLYDKDGFLLSSPLRK